MNAFKVFFSNRTERLYQAFKQNLFQNSNPFSKRLVIVSSSAMKSWLILQLANDPDIGIAAGIEVEFLESAIQRLEKTLSRSANSQQNSYKTALELVLAIEVAIKGVLLNKNDGAIVQPLIDYVGEEASIKSKRRQAKRILLLSISLAKIFFDYGLYGECLLSKWKNNPPSHWQHLLWEKLEQRFAPWNYPNKKLNSFELDPEWQPEDLQIHLFGLSYLAPLHHKFFLKIAQQLPVYYYVFSPCQRFWSDQISDIEKVRLISNLCRQRVSEAQQTALEDILSDTNPLLANFGKLGRKMAEQIESSEGESFEEYALPSSVVAISEYRELIDAEVFLEETQQPMTLLQAIQADIALLRNPAKSEKLVFNHYDETIQIHAAPKAAREVQIVYDLIMSLIEKHANDSIPMKPSDILVMAPDITDYSSFIRTVFDSPESNLAYHLMDLQLPSQHPLIQSYLQLLKLPQSRWEISTLINLFECKFFKLHQEFPKDDLRVLIEWLKKAEIRWGNNAKHRNELLMRSHCQNEMVEESWHGTWEHGLGRLLDGLAMQANSEFDCNAEIGFTPLNGVEAIQGELLGAFIKLLKSLSQDLSILINGTLMTLQEWSEYLRCLLDAYFICDKEEASSYKCLLDQIGGFAKASTHLSLEKFNFETIQRHLIDSLEAQTSSQKESNLQSIRFCSLLPMRAVPAKVVILMGMKDGNFPRKNVLTSLNLLADEPERDYYPSQVEFDRYLFLEALLSAREYFIVTYESQLPGDSKIQMPSLLIKELLYYLDNSYLINIPNDVRHNVPVSAMCCFDHPLIPFHKKYFLKDSRFKSYSLFLYRAATAYYSPSKSPPSNFLQMFTALPDTSDEIEKLVTVSLSSLSSFVKNPLKNYFNKELSIYIDSQEKRQLKVDEEFVMTKYDESKILREAFINGSDEVFLQAETFGLLPRGPFKVTEIENVKEDLKKTRLSLASLGIDFDDVFEIEFNVNHASPMFLGKHWKLPPLDLEVDETTFRVVGKIEMVTKQGLIVFKESKAEKTIEIWPTMLVLASLIKLYSLPIAPQAIFVKGFNLQIKDVSFNCPVEMLKAHLKHYLKSKKVISPLQPQWVASIIEADSEAFKKIFEATEDSDFNHNYNEYHKWLMRSSPIIDLEKSVQQWQMTAKALYGDLFANWHPKRNVKSKAADEHI